MSKIYIPEGYKSSLDLKETQIAIKKVKDFFQAQLTAELNLHRVTAPLLLRQSQVLMIILMAWSALLHLV